MLSSPFHSGHTKEDTYIYDGEIRVAILCSNYKWLESKSQADPTIKDPELQNPESRPPDQLISLKSF